MKFPKYPIGRGTPCSIKSIHKLSVTLMETVLATCKVSSASWIMLRVSALMPFGSIHSSTLPSMMLATTFAITIRLHRDMVLTKMPNVFSRRRTSVVCTSSSIMLSATPPSTTRGLWNRKNKRRTSTPTTIFGQRRTGWTHHASLQGSLSRVTDNATDNSCETSIGVSLH